MLYNTNTNGEPLNLETWDICKGICEILKYFNDATVLLSGVYYPMTNILLQECVNIAFVFYQYSTTYILSDHVDVMKQKWLTYFDEIPQIFLLAYVLDPIVKWVGMKNLLTVYYEYINDRRVDGCVDVEKTCDFCLDLLRDMYSAYRQEYAHELESSSL